MTLILTIFLAFQAQAKENWFCTTQASKVLATTVEACGVGTGETEARARLDAFDQANLEFQRVCGTRCTGEPTPMRTECEQTQTGFTCHRMVSFSTRETDVKSVPHGKIKVGMAKSDALAILGQPESVISNPGFVGSAPYVQLMYSGPACTYLSCYVILSEGKISDITGIKSSLQEF